MPTEPPNMLAEYKAELKDLRKQQTAADKEADRTRRKLITERAKLQRRLQRTLAAAEREHQKLCKEIKRSTLAEDDKVLREANAIVKNQTNLSAALQKRIDVLSGRLSS